VPYPLSPDVSLSTNPLVTRNKRHSLTMYNAEVPLRKVPIAGSGRTTRKQEVTGLPPVCRPRRQNPRRSAPLAMFFPSSGIQGCRIPVHYAHPMRWS
jgi:hypothetical protein